MPWMNASAQGSNKKSNLIHIVLNYQVFSVPFAINIVLNSPLSCFVLNFVRNTNSVQFIESASRSPPGLAHTYNICEIMLGYNAISRYNCLGLDFHDLESLL